jgi:hypothetical protein
MQHRVCSAHNCYTIDRDDLVLVSVVETPGSSANGIGARLCVVAIPDALSWSLARLFGKNIIHEDHRTWEYDTIRFDRLCCAAFS